jgi:uncharacterized protein (DUF1810 family)
LARGCANAPRWSPALKRSIDEIFDHPDDMKFHSSMTLFAHAAPREPIFAACLQKYFGGQPDPRTLARL